MVAARGAHHLLGQGRGLAVLLGGRWRDLAGGDREVEAGDARGAGKKWFSISDGWQTTNLSIPLLVVQPFGF